MPLNKGSGKAFLSKHHFGKAPEGSEGVRHIDVSGTHALGGGNSKCKGPEAGVLGSQGKWKWLVWKQNTWKGWGVESHRRAL